MDFVKLGVSGTLYPVKQGQRGPRQSEQRIGGVRDDGRSTRWNDHRAARRAELVAAARRAVHQYGPGVSMGEIAAKAETSKSVCYRYFEDKERLRQAVGAAVVSDMHDALVAAAGAAPTPVGGLRAMVHVYLKWIEQSPNIYWYVAQTPFYEPAQLLDHGTERTTERGTGQESADAAASSSNGVGQSGGAGQSEGISPSKSASQPESASQPDAAAQPDAVGYHDAPLSAYLDSVIEVVARPYAELTKVPADVATAWAAGAIGFVRGAGEWWLARRQDQQDGQARQDGQNRQNGQTRQDGQESHNPATSPSGTAHLDRELLAEYIAQWLWRGPVGVLTGTSLRTPAAHNANPKKAAEKELASPKNPAKTPDKTPASTPAKDQANTKAKTIARTTK